MSNDDRREAVRRSLKAPCNVDCGRREQLEDRIEELKIQVELHSTLSEHRATKVDELQAENQRLKAYMEQQELIINDLEKFTPDKQIEFLKSRIAELEAKYSRLHDAYELSEKDVGKYKATIKAILELPDKWRKYSFDNPEAAEYIDSTDCADELEALLPKV